MRYQPFMPRPIANSPSRAAGTQTTRIPQTHSRALDRRHVLDEQQRTFQSAHFPHPVAGLHHLRRPPA